MGALTPVRRQVVVGRDPDDAYRLWVDEIGQWWPIGSHGRFGAGSRVVIDGGRIVETAPDGRQALWGILVDQQPGRRLAFTWHPSGEERVATNVEVSLVPLPGQEATLVTLEHSGWESRDQRVGYRVGWVGVLGEMVAHAPVSEVPGDVWLVLEHRAGPSAPPEGVFASPDFRLHAQSLAGPTAEGVLVAAGPLTDVAGGGMAVVCASGPAEVARIVRAAQLDDGSVVNGLLTVRARPWNVVMGRRMGE